MNFQDWYLNGWGWSSAFEQTSSPEQHPPVTCNLFNSLICQGTLFLVVFPNASTILQHWPKEMSIPTQQSKSLTPVVSAVKILLRSHLWIRKAECTNTRAIWIDKKCIDMSKCLNWTNSITHLLGSVSLNLSSNGLTGQIPPDIGDLEELNVLDISKNWSGQIPSLSQIDPLGKLNLLNNSLSGRIPKGTQPQGFDVTI